MSGRANPFSHRSFAVFAACAVGSLLAGCAGSADSLQDSLSQASASSKTAAADKTKSELEKATEYWGKKHKEQPTDLAPALNYAKDLKALGQRQQALEVLEQASIYHGQDRELASEYGRLALEVDKISIAKQMLAIADDLTAPDWRVVSARGTVLAKEGKYRDAIPFYEKALNLSADQPSVLNNLAMAHAMNGEAAKAEEILRRLEAKGGNAKTRQNLALVLSLQGKFDEAKQVSAKDLGPDGAQQNIDYMRQMVKVQQSSDWATSTHSGAAREPVSKVSAAAADPLAAEDASGNIWTSEPAQSVPSGPLQAAGPAVLRGMATR